MKTKHVRPKSVDHIKIFSTNGAGIKMVKQTVLGLK